MRKITLLLTTTTFFATLSYGQKGFGFDLGLATSKSAMFDIKYFKNKNAFSVGATYEFNDALGKKVTEQLSNYGRTTNGNGDYFFTVDFGYTRIITQKFSLTGELSVGGRNYYTNYSDSRFTEGGYHMINKTTSLFGFGGIITYTLSNSFGLCRCWCSSPTALCSATFAGEEHTAKAKAVMGDVSATTIIFS